jgi:hypothetical protein
MHFVCVYCRVILSWFIFLRVTLRVFAICCVSKVQIETGAGVRAALAAAQSSQFFSAPPPTASASSSSAQPANSATGSHSYSSSSSSSSASAPRVGSGIGVGSGGGEDPDGIDGEWMARQTRTRNEALAPDRQRTACQARWVQQRERDRE